MRGGKAEGPSRCVPRYPPVRRLRGTIILRKEPSKASDDECVLFGGIEEVRDILRPLRVCPLDIVGLVCHSSRELV